MNRLALELTADANPLIKSLDSAQRSVDRFLASSDAAGHGLGGGVNRALEAFEGLAKGGATAAGVLAGATAALATAGVLMAVSAGHQAEALQQQSAITGIATDALQDYDVILSRANLTGDDLVQVMKRMSTSLDQARQGTGAAGDRFRQLGIDIATVTSTDDLIRKISSSSNKFADGLEKSAIMSDLLGKGWQTFIKAFGNGASAMDEATEASRRLGASLSGGQLTQLATMDDHIDDLTTAWKRFGQQLGSFVAPAVDFAARALSNLLAMASNTLKNLNSLGGVNAAPDTRQNAPAFVDTAKMAEQAQKAADVDLKFSEALFKNEAGLAQARLQNYEAHLAAKAGLDLSADVNAAMAHEAALQQMADFTLASLDVMISNYQTYYEHKRKLFLGDEKSQAELAKFEVEASQHALELLNQYEIAKLASDAKLAASARTTEDLMRKLQLQPYDDAVAKAKALDDAQHALYQSEAGLLGASDAARRVRFNLIDEEAARQRVVIEQTIQDEERKAQAIQNLETQTETKRRQAIQQFPTFFEQQMQSIVASNAFSVGQIITTWTSGVAGAIVNGGNFVKAAWQSTQIALIQGALNTGVQLAAQWALQASVELGILTATEATKMGLKTASEAEQTAAAYAGAEARKAIAEGEAATSIGLFATVGAALKALFIETVWPAIVAVGEFIMGVLGAIAEALSATVFGIPYAGAILVGIAAIAGALAATGNLGFKDGGIGDFGAGTPATLHGREAIIPLNGRGAAFMQDVFGAGGGSRQTIHTHVYLNGREMARAISDEQPGALRTMGAF